MRSIFILVEKIKAKGLCEDEDSVLLEKEISFGVHFQLASLPPLEPFVSSKRSCVFVTSTYLAQIGWWWWLCCWKPPTAAIELARYPRAILQEHLFNVSSLAATKIQ